jgi:CBS domain-containing protein
MTIEEILMTKGPDVLIALPDNTVFEAARMMTQADCGSVVVQSDTELLGIFTERDLLKRVAAKGLDINTTRLDEVMSSPVKTCALGDDIRQVADRMESDRIRHLIVVEGDVVIGMVSLRDILRAGFRQSIS